MSVSKQENFYKKVGRALTIARQQRNMSITQLVKLSGEHHKTIAGIEAGKPHYLHQAIWMKSILGIDIYSIMRDTEGNTHGEENRNVSLKDFI